MAKKKTISFLEDAEKNWLYSLVGGSETLTLSGANREAIQTNTSFLICQERREADSIYARKYELLVQKGKAIVKENKRR